MTRLLRRDVPPFQDTELACPVTAPLALRRIDQVQSPEFASLCKFVLHNPAHTLAARKRLPTRADAVDLVMSSPTSAHQARKYLWGIFLHGDLIGYLDVVRNWPVGHVHIGALMVAERLQGQGHGSQALQLLAQRTKGWSGIRRWRLAVLETHTAARAFWAHQGFVATGQRQQRADYSAALLVMEKVIGH